MALSHDAQELADNGDKQRFGNCAEGRQEEKSKKLNFPSMG